MIFSSERMQIIDFNLYYYKTGVLQQKQIFFLIFFSFFTYKKIKFILLLLSLAKGDVSLLEKA